MSPGDEGTGGTLTLISRRLHLGAWAIFSFAEITREVILTNQHYKISGITRGRQIKFFRVSPGSIIFAMMSGYPWQFSFQR
jgi:hypothetical protein